MPRSPRPLGAECTYHVTARGNNRQVIFHENADRAAWIELLDQSVSQRSWGIAAYCLMTNHVHLVVRTPRGDLDGGMRDLLSRYARRHNRLRGVTGHLFGGRYRATLIERDAQLRATIRYVARNPVEAGLVGRPGDWPWSSYGCLVAGISDPVRLESSTVLGLFHPLPHHARRLLACYVESDSHHGVAGRPAPSIATLTQLLGRRRGMIAAARLGYTHRQIAEALGLSRSGVSKHVNRAPSRAEKIGTIGGKRTPAGWSPRSH